MALRCRSSRAPSTIRRPQATTEQLRRRGYALLSGLYAEADIAYFSEQLEALHACFGAPQLHAPEPVWLAEGVELAAPGLALRDIRRAVKREHGDLSLYVHLHLLVTDDAFEECEIPLRAAPPPTPSG